jgi:hypothetical protein
MIHTKADLSWCGQAGRLWVWFSEFCVYQKPGWTGWPGSTGPGVLLR